MAGTTDRLLRNMASNLDRRPLLSGTKEDPSLNAGFGAHTGAINTPADIMRRSSWVDSTFILLGCIMGSGTLGLPNAMATLGWYMGITVCVVFGFFAVYSGLLLSRVRNLFCPEVEGFCDVAFIVSGPRFEGFTRWAIWMNWLFLLPYYLMASSHAIQVAIGEHTMCFYYRALCVMAALLIPLQLRTLNSLSILAGSSGFAIVAAMVFTLADFVLVSELVGTPAANTTLLPEAGTEFTVVYGSTASFIFAYQGQSIFLEVMREMKKPEAFPKTVGVANITMMLVYLTITMICYHYKGDTLPPFLPDAIETHWIRVVVGSLVAFNLYSSYLLTNVPLAIAWHERIWPSTARDYTSAKARFHWFIITSGLLLFSFAVANSIPFFGAFQGMIGSALGAPILFGWPALFFVLASKRFHVRIGWFDQVMCALFLGVLLPSCFGIGFYSSFMSLLDGWKNNSPPFSCDPSSS
jgi:vesicular inhibitory amino acid transporter